jgi:hypothetical protein
MKIKKKKKKKQQTTNKQKHALKHYCYVPPHKIWHSNQESG